MDLEHTGTRHCQRINHDRSLVGESNANGVASQLPERSEASPNLRQRPSQGAEWIVGVSKQQGRQSLPARWPVSYTHLTLPTN